MANVEELQQQVRENSDELGAFMRDLNSWTKEMEAKDSQLRAKKSKQGSSVATAPPPVRTAVIEEKTTVIPPKEPPAEVKKEARIRSTDYSKWDSFDPDKACKELDEDIEVIERSDDEDWGEIEEAEAERKRQQAIVEKDRGNGFFKMEKYDEAIACYTKGIQCDPLNPVLPANRAMALLKKGQLAAAEADCTLALELDPQYVKAFQRRATARSGLKRVNEAIEDFKQVLELEPKNKMAKMEMEKLLEKKDEGEKTVEVVEEKSFSANIKEAFQKKSSDKSLLDENIKAASTKRLSKPEIRQTLEPGQVLPISKPPHLRSKKPMRRIEITEVGDVDMVQAESVTKTKERVKITEVGDVKDSEIVEVGGTNDVEMEVTCGSKSTGLQKEVEEEINEKLRDTNISDDNKLLHVKPRTSVQFYTAWRPLSLEHRAEYLGQFTTDDYPTVFKQNLEPIVFGEIIRVLDQLFLPAGRPVLGHMLGLAKVKRISALVMFADAKEREAIGRILAACRGTEAEVARVRKVFEN